MKNQRDQREASNANGALLIGIIGTGVAGFISQIPIFGALLAFLFVEIAVSCGVWCWVFGVNRIKTRTGRMVINFIGIASGTLVGAGRGGQPLEDGFIIIYIVVWIALVLMCFSIRENVILKSKKRIHVLMRVNVSEIYPEPD